MALSGSLSTPSGRAQLERAVADALRRKFAITPRIRDLINEEVAAFCASNSRFSASQLKGLQLSVAAKVSDHPDAKRALRLRSPRVGAQRTGWRGGGASGAAGSRSRALAAAGDTALRYGLVPSGTGGAGQPPLTARGRMEKTRGMAEEVARRREGAAAKRGGGAARPGSAAQSSRVPWRGAAEQSPGAVMTEEEAKGSGRDSRGALGSRGSRRSAGSRRGSPRTGAGASGASGRGGGKQPHHLAGNSSDEDSADEAGSGDDHVSVESEEDSEGEGEMRVVRYGRSALRTHLNKRGDEPTRKRLGRVERAVVRDPNPEVVEGIVTEALMKRKAKEDAARLKSRQAEFRTLLKEQEEEKKMAALLDADEDERFGEMLRKQAAHLEAKEKEAAARSKAAAREELQARIKTAERVVALRKREEADRVAAEKASIEASIAADEAEKEEERRTAEAARRRIKEQIAENESFNAARKQAEREERERDRVEMDSYARAMREQEEARRRNFAKAFGTPAEYHTEGERLREEAAARDKAEKRRERKEHADRMAKLQAMEKEAEAERREKAAANRADLLRQMAEKDAAKEDEARVSAAQLRMLRMRARREEGEEAAERLEEKRKALALRQALDKQMAIDDDIERSRREAEKLAVAAQVYGIADDKELLSEVAKQLRGRRRVAKADGTAAAPATARRINRVGVRTSTRLVSSTGASGSAGLGVSGTGVSARVG